MRRLTEHQVVQLCPRSAKAPMRRFAAYVLAMDGRVAALDPVDRLHVLRLPEEVPDTLMVFDHAGQPVCLRGRLRSLQEGKELRFRVEDTVFLPRARSSRIKLCAPVTLTVLEGPGAGSTAELAAQTANIGCDGLALEAAPGLEPAARVALELMLPGEDDPVRATAVVGPATGAPSQEVRFDQPTGEYRQRLRGWVLRESRRRLAMARQLRHDEDSW